MSDVVIPAIKQYEEEMIAIRRHLHAHPELSLQEFETSQFVAEKLTEWGYRVTREIGKTGLVGTLSKGHSAKSIGLRADMDALPIQETTGLSYASQHPGKMHACGHDGHTTILLSAARYLASDECRFQETTGLSYASQHPGKMHACGHDGHTTILLSAARYLASDECRFDGTVHVIFQPAEEAIGGADLMIQDGLFERFPCDAIYALHNRPGLPAGKFGFYAGHFMASADTVKITLHGKGGHGAHPENTVDPLVAAAALIMSLQTIVSRNVTPGETAIVTVGMLHAGVASNVIPETAEMELTVRAMKPEVRELLIRRIHEISELTARSYGARATLQVCESYPVLTNSAQHTADAKALAIEVFGRDAVEDNIIPSTGSEDFSFMLEKRPGCYFLLGNDSPQGQGCSLHNPGYDFNDQIISAGASFFVRLVQRHCC